MFPDVSAPPAVYPTGRWAPGWCAGLFKLLYIAFFYKENHRSSAGWMWYTTAGITQFDPVEAANTTSLGVQRRAAKPTSTLSLLPEDGLQSRAESFSPWGGNGAQAEARQSLPWAFSARDGHRWASEWQAMGHGALEPSRRIGERQRACAN